MRIGEVDWETTPVVYVASRGDWKDIPKAASRAFALLEATIPPRGRKMFGYWHPPRLEYRACYGRQPGDAPSALGLAEDTIPGGRYRRARIKGRDAIAQIPAAYETLQASGEVRSDGRPWFEFYRRHDCVDVLVPV